jgi:cysteine desulfurase
MSKKPATKSKKNSVYLDNNATTEACKASIDATIKWLRDPTNPSSDSKMGISARKMIKSARGYILNHCSAKNYTVVFTSCASESNSMIIRSTVEAYIKHKRVKPHIVTSLTEHKSILKCCDTLRQLGMVDVTYISPGISGCIPPSLVKRGIQPNTCLVSIMAANNELGCINNLKEIGAIAHEHKIPFHSDFVQLFGKLKYNLPKHNIDAISVSFHKLHGPTGCGLLILNNDLVDGYGLDSQIAGTQQRGLRGGTQNVAAIAGAIAAMKHTFTRRIEKNKKLYALRQSIIDILSKSFHIGEYKDYVGKVKPDNANPLEIVFLGQLNKSNALPNTLLISIAKNEGPSFCNNKLKKALDRSGIIVSVGSACNTSSAKASHVLDAIKAPDVIKRGVIRVSLCDTTTKKDIQCFIETFVKGVRAQVPRRYLP